MAAVSGTGNTPTQITKPYVEARPLKNDSQQLGKDDFMKLLLAQMKYQDPLEPMDNKESIAQMAQFSSVEKLENLNKSFESFATNQKISNVLAGASMVGKDVEGNVTVRKTVKETDQFGNESEKSVESQELMKGTVKSVTFKDGKPVLKMFGTDNKDYIINMEDVTSIST